MKHLKTGLILLLTLTTIGGAVLAWKQYGELVQLRAVAMNRDERADFQKRIWDLEKMNRELEDRLAAARSPDSPDLAAGTAEERGGERGPRGGRGDPAGRADLRQQFEAMRELTSKPEFQALVGFQQRAAIEARYAALFRSLNLNDEQTRKLTNLLADRGNVRRDVDEAARAAGIDPRSNPEAFRKLFTDAQNELNSAIKSVIGDQGFAQLQSFEQTLPQRAVVDTLQQRLANTGMPLTPQQSEQLVSILAANTPPRPLQPPAAPAGPPVARGMLELGVPGFAPGGAPGRGGPDIGGLIAGLAGGIGDNRLAGAAPVTAAAVAQAQTVLAPPQVAALQQIQQQQQAQQQLQQLVRDTVARPPTPPPAPPTTKTGKGGG